VNGLLALVGAATAQSVLLLSGFNHARHAREVRTLVHRQQVWPRYLEWPVVVALVAAEISIGGYGLAMILVDFQSPPASVVHIAALFLFLLYAAYAAHLLRSRPGAPCACSIDELPANIWTVVRALILAILAGLPLLAAGDLLHPVSAAGAIGVAAASAFTTVLWILPSALANPISPRGTQEAGVAYEF
jgi:hypothetical protein